MSNDNMKTIMQVFHEYGLANVQLIAGKNQKQCIRIMYNGQSISTSAWTRKNAEEFAKTCVNCGNVSDAISINHENLNYQNEDDENKKEYTTGINRIRYSYSLITYDTIIDFITSDDFPCFSVKNLIKVRTDCKTEDGMTRKEAHKAAMDSIRNGIKSNKLALFKGRECNYITISYIYAAWEIEQGNTKPNKDTAEEQAKKIVNEINKLRLH